MQQLRAMKGRQEGMTMIGWLILIAVIGFFAVFIIRLFPIYMEHFNVKSSLNSLATDTDVRGGGAGSIRDHLDKRLQINDVSDVNDDDITITQNDTGYQVNITYDVKTSFIYNISFLVHFNDTVEVPAR